MCSCRRIASITAVLALLAFLAWLIFHSSEPSYQGKSLSAWLDKAWQNQEGTYEFFSEIHLDTPSARAIRAMGQDALPSLLRMAHTRDTFLRWALGNLSEQHRWLGLHPQNFKEIQEKALYGFLVLGPEAKSALPELISMLNDPAPEVRVIASFAIAKIGPDGAPAIPGLQRLITNSPAAYQSRLFSRDFERALAAFALGGMGPVARSALPQIELLRKDSDAFVRAAAEVASSKSLATASMRFSRR